MLTNITKRDVGCIVMKNDIYRTKITELLRFADITVDGKQPYDIQIHHPDFFKRVIGQGSLGLGEAYMDGWWQCEQLDEFIYRALTARLQTKITTLKDKLFYVYAHFINRQTGKKAFEVGSQHYDVGNDLYERMLDKRMIYTCGYWQDANDLDQAQEHKLELVCRKLKLQPGMRVLDIGCGWGGAARYMAEKYDVEVLGISVSQEQVDLANAQSDGFNVSFEFADYRDLNQSFDRVFSLGMFEHVGYKNYADYFKVVDRCLNDGGLFLLHTIGFQYTSEKVDPWIERYIFPNSILPSAELISKHSAPYFKLEDWHNFGLDYVKTLHAWDQNISAAWSELPNYDDEFQRKWHYYLMCCAGSFKACNNHLWQIVFSKGEKDEPYQAVRSAVTG